MAFTRCPHCQGMRFETKQAEPAGAVYKSIFIQCYDCGAPFAAQDYFNLGALLKDQEAKIVELSRKVDQLDYSVRQILDALRR